MATLSPDIGLDFALILVDGNDLSSMERAFNLRSDLQEFGVQLDRIRIRDIQETTTNPHRVVFVEATFGQYDIDKWQPAQSRRPIFYF